MSQVYSRGEGRKRKATESGGKQSASRSRMVGSDSKMCTFAFITRLGWGVIHDNTGLRAEVFRGKYIRS
jgi:hypothetical protein